MIYIPLGTHLFIRKCCSRLVFSFFLTSSTQVKHDVVALFLALPEPERDSLVGKKFTSGGKSSRGAKGKAKAADSDHTAPVDPVVTPSKPKEAKSVDNDNETQEDSPTKAAAKGRPKKPVDPEKAAKVSLFRSVRYIDDGSLP